jgi:predicted DNA-binding transcriptional regulator YafY
MSRSARLQQLLDLLRRTRPPHSGPPLAQQLQISLRTLYRDIATLREPGAAIVGDPGVGCERWPGFLLPPRMFTADELEALPLGPAAGRPATGQRRQRGHGPHTRRPAAGLAH